MAAAPRPKPVGVEARLESLEKSVQDIKDLPMKTLRWVGGLVVGAAITVLVQNALYHEQQTQTTQAAVKQAVTATAIVTKQQQGTQP